MVLSNEPCLKCKQKIDKKTRCIKIDWWEGYKKDIQTSYIGLEGIHSKCYKYIPTEERSWIKEKQKDEIEPSSSDPIDGIKGIDWPGTQQIEQALEHIESSAKDENLKKLKMKLDSNGLLLQWQGQMANVYKATYNNEKFAIKIFTRKKEGLLERYEKLHNFFISKKELKQSPYFTTFDYIQNAIEMNLSKQGKTAIFPIVKMRWAEGDTLESFIEKTNDPKEIKTVSKNFMKLVDFLENHEIAHGDLHPKNILVDKKLNLKLVDYDCIYINDFKGKKQPETGDQDCQHPNREKFPYDEKIDRFSALVIYLALLAISEKIELKDHKDTGDFIFSKSDFEKPNKSPLFKKFNEISSGSVTTLTEKLKKYCDQTKPNIPSLKEILQS